MKKYNLKYSCLLATVLTFLLLTGCKTETRYRTYQISKSNNLVLENLQKIDHQYFQSAYPLNKGVYEAFENNYGYSGDISKEALEKEYRLSLYVNIESIDNESYEGLGGPLGLVLLPCSSSIKYDDFKKYPIHYHAHNIRYPVEKKTVGAYFKIEDLEEIGYITKDRSKQTDLCLFEKEKTGGMGYKVYNTSNKLIYTAQEINEILDEYEALR